MDESALQQYFVNLSSDGDEKASDWFRKASPRVSECRPSRHTRSIVEMFSLSQVFYDNLPPWPRFYCNAELYIAAGVNSFWVARLMILSSRVCDKERNTSYVPSLETTSSM